MIVELDKEQKIQLLEALKDGYVETDDFQWLIGSQVAIFELPDNKRGDKNNRGGDKFIA